LPERGRQKPYNPASISVSLIAYTAEVVARVLGSRVRKKIEDVLQEYPFGFRREEELAM